MKHIFHFSEKCLRSDKSSLRENPETRMESRADEFEVEEMTKIELSSDEEDENDEVSLIVLKRPAKVTRTVEDVEVQGGA